MAVTANQNSSDKHIVARGELSERTVELAGSSVDGPKVSSEPPSESLLPQGR